MKLTIPSIKNIKRREAFLLAHTDYYSPIRFEYELLRIAHIRAEKRLRWEQPSIKPLEERMKETSKSFVVKKPSFVKQVTNMFKSQRGN